MAKKWTQLKENRRQILNEAIYIFTVNTGNRSNIRHDTTQELLKGSVDREGNILGEVIIEIVIIDRCAGY